MESFVLMPLATMSLPFGGLPTAALDLAKTSEITPQAVLSQKLNIEASKTDASNQADELEALTVTAKAAAIDDYFRSKGMPLAGTGRKMVEEANKYGLDWRLLPAIAVRESTGGKFACKSVTNSFFGYGSCKINFKSKDHAIEVVAQSISGNKPSTAHHYAGKSTIEILEAYNPRTVVAHYPEQVMKIMDTIGDKEMGSVLVMAN